MLKPDVHPTPCRVSTKYLVLIYSLFLMKALAVTFFGILIALSLYSQQNFRVTEVPVFKSPKDSIEYAKIQAEFQRILASKSNVLSTDSLFRVMREIATRSITGYRRVYKGSLNFFPYDSLPFITDFSSVKTLSISNIKSNQIPENVWNCKNLETLELVNTRIRTLKKIKRLVRLSNIYVLNNRSARRLRVGKSESVKSFVIRGNNPELIPSTFRRLKNLERLDLAATDLKAFPIGIANNGKLKELQLSNNFITLKNDRIEFLPSIEKLELQRNRIEHLPSSIQNFPNLKRLTLNFNSISSVDSSLALLTKLEQLSLYNNKLRTIPDGIYGLSNLKEIDLYFNQIERLESQIQKLKNLEVLYLSNNRLLSLPDNISSLSSLKELYLSNNRLSELPSNLINLSHLKVLRINSNRLIQVPKDLPKLTNLENLDISDNQLTDLPAGLSQLPKLKLLVIMNNPWDDSTLPVLTTITTQLRNREVVVHVNE